MIREYLFIRNLETLIVFDRMQSSATEGSLAKTFLLHTWGEHAVSGTATLNDQSVKLTTLIPATLTGLNDGIQQTAVTLDGAGWLSGNK